MEKIKEYWRHHPLNVIILAAIGIRLLSVIFARGFGMHDDHFLVIEAAQSWVEGKDYNNWLPKNSNGQASGHSWLYPGLHYLLLKSLEAIGICGSQAKMYVVRLIHAALAVLSIYWAYKITEKRSNKAAANTVGLILALWWFLPFMSVRNLAEFVCITPLMAGMWMLVRRWDDETPVWYDLAIGLVLGLAFSTRFQSLFFIGGLGLALLIEKRWKQAIILGLGTGFCIVLIQGGVDFFLWGRPFVEFTEYIRYNLVNKYNYETNSWYTYLLLLAGILVPPVSLFIFFGWFRAWKKQLILFLPALIFLAFHSYFPNKQERFILPIIPFMIIAGIIGWQEFVNLSGFWQRRPGLLKACWTFAWVLNLILLPVISTMYSKRARVEAMHYLGTTDRNLHHIVQEDLNHDDVKMPARYYLDHQWPYPYDVSSAKPWYKFRQIMDTSGVQNYPQYALFYEDKNLENRVDSLRSVFPHIQYMATIQPGFVDKILYKLNKKNANQVIYIYKIEPTLNKR